MVMWVQFLEGPNKLERQKHLNFGAISDNFRLWSRIYPEWTYRTSEKNV